MCRVDEKDLWPFIDLGIQPWNTCWEKPSRKPRTLLENACRTSVLPRTQPPSGDIVAFPSQSNRLDHWPCSGASSLVPAEPCPRRSWPDSPVGLRSDLSSLAGLESFLPVPQRFPLCRRNSVRNEPGPPPSTASCETEGLVRMGV